MLAKNSRGRTRTCGLRVMRTPRWLHAQTLSSSAPITKTSIVYHPKVCSKPGPKLNKPTTRREDSYLVSFGFPRRTRIRCLMKPRSSGITPSGRR